MNRKRERTVSHLVESLQRRMLLAAIAWDGGGDGVSWTDPLNWSGDIEPVAADDVTVAAGVHVKFASATRTIHTLDLSGSLIIDGGRLVAEDHVIRNSGVVRAYRSGTLEASQDVQLDGEIRLGDGPVTAGRIFFTSETASLTGTGRVSYHGAVPIDGASGAVILNTGSVVPHTLTIGSGLEFEVAPGAAGIISSTNSRTTAHRVVFNGSVHLAGADTRLTLGSPETPDGLNEFINHGTIAVSDGAMLFSRDRFSTSTIIRVENAAFWQHAVIAGADLGRIHAAGTGEVRLFGTLDLSTTPYAPTADNGAFVLDWGSIVRDGELRGVAGANLTLSRGTLHNVTITGDVTLTSPEALNVTGVLSIAGRLRFASGSHLQVNSLGLVRGISPDARVIAEGTAARFRGASGTNTLQALSISDLRIESTLGGDLTLSGRSVNLSNTVLLAEGPGSKLGVKAMVSSSGEIIARNGGSVTLSEVAGPLGRMTVDMNSLISVGTTPIPTQTAQINAPIDVAHGATLRFRANMAATAAGVINLNGTLIAGAPIVEPGSALPNIPRTFWRSLVNNGAANGWSLDGAGPAVASSGIVGQPGRIVALVAATELFPSGAGTFAGQTIDNRELILRPALAADLNLDEVVNFSDLLILAQNYGRNTTHGKGDVDNDGTVDMDDLVMLAQLYGEHFNASPAATAPLAARRAR